MFWPLVFITATSLVVVRRASLLLIRNARASSRGVLRSLLRPKVNLPVRLKGFENPMSLLEAYRILNVPPITSQARVREAHRQLMLRNHPDNGGSNYVASKVNEAKELICGENKSSKR
ncbi:putative mitochondrial import inner membrane translocase subunit TIM14 [Cryptosporidium felis]|nr:putative mitochondrial import inner membrane translocase subunit TIM14 [Cryptosporidium felis]